MSTWVSLTTHCCMAGPRGELKRAFKGSRFEAEKTADGKKIKLDFWWTNRKVGCQFPRSRCLARVYAVAFRVIAVGMEETRLRNLHGPSQLGPEGPDCVMRKGPQCKKFELLEIHLWDAVLILHGLARRNPRWCERSAATSST